MGPLSLSELRPGMILLSPLFHDSGVMLLPRGTRLTTRHLEQFEQWGVREALVEALSDDALSGDPETRIDPELLDAIDRALDEKFPIHAGDEIMAEVKRIARKMTIEEAIARGRYGK